VLCRGSGKPEERQAEIGRRDQRPGDDTEVEGRRKEVKEVKAFLKASLFWEIGLFMKTPVCGKHSYPVGAKT
jgi:hypothetical protein